MGTQTENEEIVTICKANVNLEDWINEVVTLKPLTAKLFRKLGDQIPLYHIESFTKSRVVEEEKESADGETYIFTKMYGVASMTKECVVSANGAPDFRNYSRKKVLIMNNRSVDTAAGPVMPGMYVKYSDIKSIKAKAKRVVLTTSNNVDDDDE